MGSIYNVTGDVAATNAWTVAGSTLGSPYYMSPEQARGEPNIDVRVDVYAAAVMLYECVVGEVPFDAGNYNALLQIILSRPPASPRSRGADMGAPVEQVLLACLAKKREERPPNARVMRELFISALDQDDGVILDSSAWTFRESPRPVPKSLAPAKPAAPLQADVFKSELGTGSFDIPRNDRHVPQPLWSAHAVADNAARAIAPTPSLEAPALELDIPTRQPAHVAPARLEVEAQRAPARAQPRQHQTSGKQRPVRAPRRSVVGGVLGWLAVLAAIGLLIYVGSFVFERRDPRKARKTGESAAPAEAEPPAGTPPP